MSIETELAKLEERRKREEGLMEEPKVKNDKTLKQIRENGQDFDRFGKFLDAEGQQTLGEEFLKSKKNPDQMDRATTAALAEQKEKFLILMERCENATKALDAQTITKLAESVPELKSLLALGGPETIQRALKSQLPEMAIESSERNRFETLATNLEQLARLKKQHEEDEKKIKEAFAKYDVGSDSEIAAILHGGGDVEEIANDIAKKKGWFKRHLGGAPSAEEVQKRLEGLIGRSRDIIEQNRDEINDSLSAVGGALEVSLMDNKAVHDAMVADLFNEKLKKPEVGMSFKDAEEAMTVDKAEARARWEEVIANQRKMVVDNLKKEWLDAERENRWQDYYEAFIQDEAKTKSTTPEDVRKQYEGDAALKKSLFDTFLKTDADIEPDSDMVAEWEAEAEKTVTIDPDVLQRGNASYDIESLQQEALYDNFTSDYVSGRTKGKGGFWASITSDFLKKGMFDDLFG